MGESLAIMLLIAVAFLVAFVDRRTWRQALDSLSWFARDITNPIGQITFNAKTGRPVKKVIYPTLEYPRFFGPRDVDEFIELTNNPRPDDELTVILSGRSHNAPPAA